MLDLAPADGTQNKITSVEYRASKLILYQDITFNNYQVKFLPSCVLNIEV